MMTLDERLLAARAAATPCAVEAEALPTTEAEAYAAQHAVSRRLGPIGGWKVGAAGPEAPPSAAPLPLSVLFPSGISLGRGFSDRLIESEIAFRLAADLPPRPGGYKRAEILAAIGPCLPVIEVVQWRILAGGAAPPLLKLADHLGHGALILGEARQDWRQMDFATLSVRQEIAGSAPLVRTGNPAGDMIRLIHWLAEEGAIWAGGLKAGQIVTCGSWTGALPAPAGAAVRAEFAGFAAVSLHFDAS